MRQFLCQRQCLLAALQGLVWVAKIPQDLGRIGAAKHPGIGSVVKGLGVVVLGTVEDHLFQVCTGRDKLSKVEHGRP